MNEIEGALARLQRLAIFFITMFFVLSALLIYWQIVRAQNLVNRPDDPRLYAQRLAVHRGTILDRRGTVLVQTTFPQGDPVRTLYDTSLSPLIGYHSQRYDNAGLEAAYNDYLNGAATDQPIDNTMRRLLHEPPLGDTLQLTIDDRIQQLASNALGDGPGVALVADPRSGQILAMVSKPTYNANRIDESGYWQSLQGSGGRLVNRALDGRYPPGSTFKTVTLSTALARGAYTLSSVFSGLDATGPLFIQGTLLASSANNLPPGVTQVTLKDAFKYSDNIVFATIAQHLGANALVDGAASFGFGGTIPFDLPTASSVVTDDLNDFSEYDLASAGFGQGPLLATPLQMLLVDEAIANGGAIMQPFVVRKIMAPNGEVLLDQQPQLWRQALDSGAARQVAQAMLAVVNDPGGSGYAARLPGVQVAGKTGTAQTGGATTPPHAWFIGYAPAAQPRLAVLVLKEQAGEGSTVAAPIAGQILAGALPLYH
ncbi:MAG TPA: penicillin-binding protein 2 [Chloroflexota bacterium]|nr:penicillin-binding protein 2 [Chloroflexota bacterium]